tara:strand:- start:165 stop:401 length:237 start_codon:yes stop_codon:yes gene_type:complete
MKTSRIFQSLKIILKYLFMIFLILNIAIYILVFLFQGDPGGEIWDNISKRNELALLALSMLYVILYSLIKGEKINSFF